MTNALPIFDIESASDFKSEEPTARLPFRNDLTAEYVRSLLSYEPETGVFRWRQGGHGKHAGDIAGSPGSRGRRYININRRLYAEHRLAWLYMTGEWPAELVDHNNGIHADNRFANLREATKTQNNRNRVARGVRYRSGQYDARIVVDGKPIYLGVFPTEEAARAAYVKATLHYFGAFSFANREVSQ